MNRNINRERNFLDFTQSVTRLQICQEFHLMHKLNYSTVKCSFLKINLCRNAIFIVTKTAD